MFYDYESGSLVTSPDGDVASGYQINEKIEDLERQVRTLTKQNQELKDIIAKEVHELERGITFCENDKFSSSNLIFLFLPSQFKLEILLCGLL